MGFLGILTLKSLLTFSNLMGIHLLSLNSSLIHYFKIYYLLYWLASLSLIYDQVSLTEVGLEDIQAKVDSVVPVVN